MVRPQPAYRDDFVALLTRLVSAGILTPGGRLSEAAVPAPPAPPESGGLTVGSYGPYGGNALPVDTPGVGVSATDSSGTVTDVNNLVGHSTKTRRADLGFA